ncbi:MAG: SDR family oxidoreductase [bacterium]|nr:SDR family oxidoreductase [bacterium]
MRLANKVAVITGGTKGIGRTTAIMMAAQGAKVAFTGRTVEAGREVEDRIREAGGTGMFVRADNRREDEIENAIASAVDAFGPITTLMNNAIATDEVSGGGDDHVDSIEFEVLDSIVRAALYGTIWATKYAIPSMREAGGGSIINVSASSSVGAIPGRPAYQASKGAINALTRQLAVDYGKQNIRANTIVVGFTNTGSETFERILSDPARRAAFERLVLLPRLGESEDVAHGAIYLASDESKNVTGTMLTIDGGALCHQAQPQLDFEALRES